MIPKKITITILLLILGTWFVLQNSSSVTAVPIKQGLTSFPKIIGQWQMVHSTQSADDIIEMLGVDDDIQYTYRNPAGKLITLYVGYYSAVGVNGGYHSPRNCLPGGGWGIDAINPYTLDVGIEGESQSVVSEMLIRNGNKYQVVLYWYQNRGRIIDSEYWEKIYLVLDALRLGRRDGTFVRIMSTVQGDDMAKASQETEAFAEEVMKTLESYLPGRTL
jgi:EpsI family protein